jgi:pyrimidine deaminase RibD-like protein
MKASDFEIRNYEKLDKIMSKLCALVVEGQKTRPEHFGKVAACVLDPDNQLVARLNCPGVDGKRIHAERAAMEAYEEKYGDIPEGSIVLTTCSPCSERMTKRDGVSCTDYINSSPVKKVYCGYSDPTQDEDQREFTILETKNSEIRELCKMFADTFIHGVNEGLMGLLTKSVAKPAIKKSTSSLADIRAASQQTQELLPPPHIRMYLHRIKDAKEKGIAPQFSASEYRELEQWVAQQKIHSNLPENFADGRNPQDKGDSKRHGINTKASVSSLRKTAKQGGRKGQLAHWLANMKAGRAKK